MKALIPIRQQSINNQPLPTVSGRELHKFLEVQKQFSIWIKARIEEYGYERGRDFIAITSDNQNCASGMYNPTPAIEYHLTLDMAKELAMVERSPMGRVARKYFIKCEQLAREMVPRMQQRLVELSPRWRQVLDYRAIGLNNKEIGKLLNLSQRSVSRTLQEMAAYGIVIGDSPARRRKTLAPQWRRCAAAGLQLPLFPPEVTQ